MVTILKALGRNVHGNYLTDCESWTSRVKSKRIYESGCRETEKKGGSVFYVQDRKVGSCKRNVRERVDDHWVGWDDGLINEVRS